MTNASRDENNVPTILAGLDSDPTQTARVVADPTTHVLGTEDSSTGSDNGPEVAPRDENSVTGWIAVSSADGVTPVVLYADSDGKLLIDSN